MISNGQKSVATKQGTEQFPFNNSFQNFDSHNLIANIQLENQKFDNQFQQQ